MFCRNIYSNVQDRGGGKVSTGEYIYEIKSEAIKFKTYLFGRFSDALILTKEYFIFGKKGFQHFSLWLKCFL